MAALLLKERGYEVGGATFELFDGCPEQNVSDAKAVCEKLGIPHYVFDYRALFSERVLDCFADGYLRGETPNPCIACNRSVKFGAFARTPSASGTAASRRGTMRRCGSTRRRAAISCGAAPSPARTSPTCSTT